jgi:A/G-specific adenine glycosylase
LKGRFAIGHTDSISRLLLIWYDGHKRALPWRDTQDPYAIWISEIMLQQTRVETVLSYFPRFMIYFPTVKALAEAPEQELLKAWEGLGYYSRARNLQKAAKQIMAEHGGRLPATLEELRSLSGVGPYTAGAIASIAFSVRTPAVDGNVMRVVSRLKGIREDIAIPGVSRQIHEEAAALVPPGRPGDFNQAVMDLGATVCLPGTPVCDKCPLSECCEAYKAGDAELLPIKTQARAPKQVTMGVGLVVCKDKILVHMRREKLLGGLYVFVLLEGSDSPPVMEKHLKALLGIKAAYAGDKGSARHVFTHRIWNMRLMHFTAENEKQIKDHRWVTLAELSELPFPTAMKAALREAKKLLNGKQI